MEEGESIELLAYPYATTDFKSVRGANPSTFPKYLMRNFIDLITNSFDNYEDRLDVEGISNRAKSLFEAKGSDMTSNGPTEDDHDQFTKRRRRLTLNTTNVVMTQIVPTNEDENVAPKEEDQDEDRPQ